MTAMHMRGRAGWGHARTRAAPSLRRAALRLITNIIQNSTDNIVGNIIDNTIDNIIDNIKFIVGNACGSRSMAAESDRATPAA
jgi:hypothetical protein